MAKGYIIGGNGYTPETVGNNLKFIYVSGESTGEELMATDATVGSSVKPIWMDAGTMTALSATVGSTKKPMWLNEGSIQALSDTVGGDTDGNYPIYMDAGTLTKYTGKLANDISGTADKAVESQTCTGTSAQITIADDTSTTLYVLGAAGIGAQTIYRESSVKIAGDVLYGACWNDYAEFRTADGKAGQVVCEDGTGKLKLSMKRLQKGANIISDTFGFIIGKEDADAKPIAVSGRVLAYPDSKNIKVGDIVCSGKDGTVSKMSRLEIILFPDRIIGEVSEIPTYKTWNKVNVDYRVWIKVK